MKKTILVLLVVGLFSLGANAQDDFKPANGQNPPPPPPMSKEKMKERKEMMLKTLKKNIQKFSITHSKLFLLII